MIEIIQCPLGFATLNKAAALALATNPVFSDLNPPDGGWSQNPAGTVFDIIP